MGEADVRSSVLSIIFEQNNFFLFQEIRFIVQSVSLCHFKMLKVKNGAFCPFLPISFALYVNVLVAAHCLLYFNASFIMHFFYFCS